ncbi:MAG: antibiotic biosynthesis monooxygenase [Anaerolineales bacterium]|nr:antibiotic biosynthesis monooxygenase [Anaerolineales bacterium]
MIAYLVSMDVKPDAIEAFKEASIINARNSLDEPGIARFDFIQGQEDPARFMFIEVYGTEGDVLAHKETDHYKIWRETVAPMMAQPRKGVRYDVVHPEEQAWWSV